MDFFLTGLHIRTEANWLESILADWREGIINDLARR
jgi:hypothetical protein